MADPVIYVAGTKRKPLAAARPLDRPRVYRKQLIYAGAFVQRPGRTDEAPFDVTDEHLSIWEREGNLMLSRGVDVPCPVGHTRQAGTKKARVLKYERDKDSLGRNSLYAQIEFVDEKAEAAFKHSDVSIYAEPEVKDGLGNKYTYPITHVAFTDYPTIPKLERFAVIAASLLEESVAMNEALAKLLKELGIEVGDDATDESGVTLLRNFLKQKGVMGGEEGNKEGEKPAAIAADRASLISASMISTVDNARIAQIDGLVASGRINKVVADDLKKQYTGSEKVKLALSRESGDEFEGMIKTLSKNTPVKMTEGSGPQVLALGNGGEEKPNALLRDAEKRAEDAKQKTGGVRRFGR